MPHLWEQVENIVVCPGISWMDSVVFFKNAHQTIVRWNSSLYVTYLIVIPAYFLVLFCPVINDIFHFPSGKGNFVDMEDIGITQWFFLNFYMWMAWRCRRGAWCLFCALGGVLQNRLPVMPLAQDEHVEAWHWNGSRWSQTITFPQKRAELHFPH